MTSDEANQVTLRLNKASLAAEVMETEACRLAYIAQVIRELVELVASLKQENGSLTDRLAVVFSVKQDGISRETEELES